MSSSKHPKGAIVVRSAEAGRLVGFASRGTAEERRQAIKDGLKASKDCLCVCHEPTTDITPHGGKCRCNGGTGIRGAMSDIDRLRAAAKEADRTAIYLHGTMTPTMHAVAALLRAVADTYAPCGCDDEVVVAALALTDAILDDR